MHPYNVTKMARKGYPNNYHYYLGFNGSVNSSLFEHFIGWGGNDLEDPYLLLENFTTISSKTIGLNNSISKWGDTFHANFTISNSVHEVPARVKV